ncbi:MAG: aldehyde ferredoxin oxidoreductase C-terminal domain-containing protein [Promethearchaeota archaeon]
MEPRILRVNITDMTCKFEPLPEKYKYKGGRGLTSQIVAEEVPPTCDPLGPNNKIVVAPGILSGTIAPSSGRLSVGGKSPLTGTIKEANAGGLTARKLGRLRIRAVIVEGWPSHSDWYNIVITKDKAELVKANEYHEMGLYDLITKVWEQYPNKPGIIGCGVAGQRLMRNAGIFGNNIENSDPGRYAGRGGLGAVLGSKRIISIITDDTGGERLEPANKELFEKGRKKLVDALNEHAVTGVIEKDGKPYGGLKNYGTNVLQNILNEAGALPTKNFSAGHFKDAKNISGEAVHELVDECQKKYGDKNKGKYGHPCHPGCIMACSNVVPYPDGRAHVAPLEYESAWALGTNCMIGDLQDVAELNRLCNDIGTDTIETGCTIAVAMESGLIPWGDGKAAIEFLKKAYDKSSPMGRLMMSGTQTMGKAVGVRRMPVVKGQSLPAYDPRPIKGIGVTYATTTMGADHTAGYTIAPEILSVGGKLDPRAVKKGELSRAFQATTAYIDQSGYCLFIAFAILDIPAGMEGMEETLAGFFGLEKFDITEHGTAILKAEREFNRQAGFTNLDDRLPEFFYEEKLPPHNVTFDVPDDELDSVYKDL